MLRDFIIQAKALSDETRVRILKLLERRELCVCELMEVLQMGQSTVSKHLGILRMAGLVDVRKEGTWSFYMFSDEALNEYNLIFREFLKHVLNEDKGILKDIEALNKLKSRAITCKAVSLKTRGVNAK